MARLAVSSLDFGKVLRRKPHWHRLVRRAALARLGRLVELAGQSDADAALLLGLLRLRRRRIDDRRQCVMFRHVSWPFVSKLTQPTRTPIDEQSKAQAR